MKTVITNNGLNIMNQTRADGTVQYWIGYFGLAYVPDENRVSESNDAPSDPLSADMTELTKTGDMIYNLFQGAMTPVGLDTDIGESAAYNLFNECMYTGSVISKFRYVLDPETGANKLIVLESVNEAGNPVEGDDIPYGLQKYSEYFGVGAKNEENSVVDKSELPIPAPLYYRGEPVAWDAGVTFNDVVSSDTRIISKSPNWDSGDKYSWNASKDFTYGEEEDRYHYLTSFAQAQSVSNFNRFHAGANVTGYAVDYEPACRNLAFATKLFPISHYDVISTTDDEHVANVKYTVEVDLDEVFSKITRQSTAYYENNQKLDPVTDKDKLAKYKLGFKFNRIGLYAVPVTLHAYNSNTADNQSKNKYNIQMQIAGNSKPRLFAVRDLSAPIVLSEDGMHKCVFNFQLNVADTGIVDESGIYYNLYESDAITWYKNQLIANASAAEAVTTLGVEINYLRQQIADMSGENTACGVGDDGDRYALEGHTHNYMKNIVDSTKLGNGAVRGIDTIEEATPLKIYQVNGRGIYKDEHGVPHFTDDESVVPLMIDASTSIVGDESMNLGKDSATLGARSINMSNYGILGKDTYSTFLMGGRGKTTWSDVDDSHLAVKDGHNSIINVDRGEFSRIVGSIWVGGDSPVYVAGSAQHTLGIGHIDLADFDADTLGIEQKLGNSLYGNVNSSALIGRNKVYSTAYQLIIAGEGESGSMQTIGRYDVLSDMNAAYMTAENASSQSLDQDIFSSVRAQTNSIVSVGVKNKFMRNLHHMVVAGDENNVLSGSKNGILIGSRINNAETYFKPKIVMSVDEFSDRYGTTEPYADDDPVRTCTGNGDIVLVGSGELRLPDGEGNVRTRNVKGVTLYLNYVNEKWSQPVTVGTVTEGDLTYFGKTPEYYADMYTTGGHTKNMLMLGDDTNTGYGSHSSIVMGDYSGTRKITLKNSFVNFMGDTTAYDHNATEGPCMNFENVWWIGAANTSSNNNGDSSIVSSTTGHVVGALAESFSDTVSSTANARNKMTYRDAFVFRGDHPYAYAHGYWYDALDSWRNFDRCDNTEDFTFATDAFYQPVHAPMIYTGGLALGGYGTNDCNFMLLKVGTSESGQFDTPITGNGAYTGASMMRATNSIGDYAAILRSTNPHGPWESATKSYIYSPRQVVDTVETIPASYTLAIPSDHVFDSDSLVMSMSLDSTKKSDQAVTLDTTTNKVTVTPTNMSLPYPGIIEFWSIVDDFGDVEFAAGETSLTYQVPSRTIDTGNPNLRLWDNKLTTNLAHTAMVATVDGVDYPFTIDNVNTDDDTITGHIDTPFTKSVTVRVWYPRLYHAYYDTDDYSAPVQIQLPTQYAPYELRGNGYFSPQYKETMTITSVSGNSVTGTVANTIAYNGTIKLEYKGYSENGKNLYNVHNTYDIDGKSYTVDHFMVDSPYSGMVLMVQDKQELDGTLHVGLGRVSGQSVYGNKKYVSIKSSYVATSNGYTLTVSGAEHGTLTIPCLYDKDTQNLNEDIAVPAVTLGGLKLESTIRFTQQGSSGTKPEEGNTNPVECTLKSTHLYVNLDYGYMVSMYHDGSSTSSNVHYDMSDNYICGMGGGSLCPTYLYLADSSIQDMYSKMVQIKLQNNHFDLYTVSPERISLAKSHLYKLLPIEWHNNTGSLITYSGYGSSGQVYPFMYEDLYGDELARMGIALS